ncbi:MAG: hypothetical protein KDD64_11405 [Bdellovibrionales bacterium]|nr:hypothetical protein [Bdellovibrionales bacterium]
MLFIRGFVLFGMLSLLPLSICSAREPQTNVEVIRDSLVYVPGDTAYIGVHFRLDQGWHIYGKDPGEIGLPTTVVLSGQSDFEMGEIVYPTPQTFESSDGVSYGYEGEVVLIVPIRIRQDAFFGKRELSAKVSWLNCNGEACMREKRALDFSLELGSEHVSGGSPVLVSWMKKLLPREGENGGVRAIAYEKKSPVEPHSEQVGLIQQAE